MRRIKAWFAKLWPWVSKKRHQELRRQYVAALLELAAAKESEIYYRHRAWARLAAGEAMLAKIQGMLPNTPERNSSGVPHN